MNSFHPSIKFTSDFSHEKITFLDLNIYKGPNFLISNILDVETYMWPGLQKSTMWAQITPSYIFANIFSSECGIPFP